MSLARKAKENFQAGELLLQKSLHNAAASRLYYSLFQAVAYALENRRNKRPGDFRLGAEHWEHGMVINNARYVRQSWDDRKLCEKFRALRTEADYDATEVEREQIVERLEAVRSLVMDVAND